VRQTVWPLILTILGAVLCVCGIPIALLGAAYWLVEAGMSMAWSLLLVAAAAVALGGLLAYLGSSAAARAAECFDRSRSELRDNIAWLKQAVRHARNHEPLH
jgi:hypothetical protein